MSNKNRLQTLRTLADTAERESSQILAERRRMFEEEQKRLEQLRNYLNEYATPEAGAGVFVDSIRTRRDFISRIRAGIEQQERVVEGLHRQLNQDLERWQETRSHALSLERYSQRLQTQVDEKLARREQGQLDEVGRQKHLARSA